MSDVPLKYPYGRIAVSPEVAEIVTAARAERQKADEAFLRLMRRRPGETPEAYDARITAFAEALMSAAL